MASIFARTIIGFSSLGLGLLFAVFSPDWIEMRLGFSADGGNGIFEALLSSVAIAIGIGLTMSAVVNSGQLRRQRKSAR
jgi:Na+/H+ antiporter NhaA